MRVLCVDDSADRAALYEAVVRSQPDMESAGHLVCADALVEQARSRGAGIVLLDLTMPGADPVQTIRDLSGSSPPVRVVAFSGRDDRETVDAAMAAGAWAFVSKHGDPQSVLAAIRRVAAGQVVLPT